MATMAAFRPGGRDPEALQGLLWSLGAHGVLLALMLFGTYLLPRPKPTLPLGIQATVVDARTLERRSQVDPAAEARRQAEAEAAERRREQERQAALDRDRQQEQQQREVEERRQQQVRAEQERQRAETQAKARAAEEKRKADAAARAAAETERRAAAQKAAEQKAAERRAAEAAERQRQAEAARRREAAELARQLEEEEALLAAEASGALNDYMNLINQKVKRNWIKPLSAKPGVECEVTVTQIPGGEVTDVRIGRCTGDEALRRSVELAFRKASPLPLPDDPALFKRTLSVLFKPEE